MKDIDFDELDKAVNSLMSNVPGSTTSNQEPVESVVEIPPSNPSSTANTVATTTSPAVVAAQPAVSTSDAVVANGYNSAAVVSPRPAAPAARRGGRFMDMVHTSSDMTPRTTSKPAMSREGIAVMPRPNEETATTSSATPEVPAVTPENTMPDPLDIVADSDTAPDAVTTESAPVETFSVAPEPPVASSAPLESPFLTDAKVEKRPLNATPSPEKPLFDLSAELARENPPANTTPDSDNTPAESGQDEPPLTPQIPELQSDLVAIESDANIQVTQAVDSDEAQKQVPEPSSPLGAASIPQQYKAQESSGDKSHAAIYDASQYPEPVTHPAKHRSGWLWVLWVILLLAVGAGGAFGLYSLGIIP